MSIEGPERHGLGMWGHPVTSGVALRAVRKTGVLCCESCLPSTGGVFLLAILENAQELIKRAFHGTVSVRAPGGRDTFCHNCCDLITTNNRSSDGNCVVQGSPQSQKSV